MHNFDTRLRAEPSAFCHAQFSEIMVRASKLTRSSNTARSSLALLTLAFYIPYQFNEVKWRRPERQLKKAKYVNRLGYILPFNLTAERKQQN